MYKDNHGNLQIIRLIIFIIRKNSISGNPESYADASYKNKVIIKYFKKQLLLYNGFIKFN